MLARQAYGTNLGENTYGSPGQPKPPKPKATPTSPQWASPAQPREQSFGTPYGGSSGFDAYKPQQPAGPNGGAMTPQGERWYSQAPSQQTTGDPRGAYAGTPDNRPAPFQMGPAQTPWGQSMDPFADRKAFVSQINNQRAQRQIDYNNNGDSMPSTWGGTPTLNTQAAMQGAGLGMGSPSMDPDYGDSLIGRLNQQFGGGSPQVGSLSYRLSDPPAYQQPQFQEQPLPQVQGTNDYSAGGMGGYVPDERLVPRPPARPDSYYDANGNWTLADSPDPRLGQRQYPQPAAGVDPGPSVTYAHPGGGWGHSPAPQPSPGSEQWWAQQNARVARAPSPGRYPYSPPSPPRRAANRPNPQQQHQAAMAPRPRPVASPTAQQQNQRWLNSLTPDNRRIYQMLQAS